MQIQPNRWHFAKTTRPSRIRLRWKWLKLTRIISAQLHEQLLEDVWVLREEAAVGLGKHLVHGLLWQFDELPEELCRERQEKQRLDINPSLTHLLFPLNIPMPGFSVRGRSVTPSCPRLTAQRDSYIRSCTLVNESNNMYSIYDFRTHTRSPTPSACLNDSSHILYKRMRRGEKKGESSPQQVGGERVNSALGWLLQTCSRTYRIWDSVGGNL